jgi:hypothetical protein
MASSYPGALDSLTNMGSTLNGPPTHSSVHANANDAIEAIQAELGTDPAGASATVKARLAALDSTMSSNATAAAAKADGLIAYSKMTGSTSVNPGSTTTIPDSSVTFTAVASRYYRIRAQLTVGTTGGSITGNLIIADGSNTPIATTAIATAEANAGDYSTRTVEWIGTLSAGSTTRLVRLQTSTGNTLTAPANLTTDYITVEDLGAV